MRIRRTGVVPGLAVAVAMVITASAVGCSSGSSWIPGVGGDGKASIGDSAGRRQADGIDADDARRIVEQFATLREVDPCALLDRDIIKDITHAATVDEPLPGEELSQCAVGTTIDEFDAGWDFTVEVGELYKPSDNTRRETVAGEEFLIDSDEDICWYTRMAGPNVGVNLKVIAPPLDDTAGEPCEMAASYIRKAVKLFTTMGQRSQGLTEPQLPLAAHDPCEAVPDVSRRLNTEAAGAPVHTYSCAVRPDPADTDSPLADQGLRITYQFTIDPRNDIPDTPRGPGGGLGAITPVTVAGHPGSQFDGNGEIGCNVAVVLDEKVVLEVDGVPFRQVVDVYTKDCAVAKQAAEAVLTKLDAT
jgi:hypothetical protein